MIMQLMKSDNLMSLNNAIFEKWRAIINREIPHAKIEHIGSTAIPGALTKGDIDLYVEVAADKHSSAVNALENLGFRVKSDTHRDQDLCMLESASIAGLAIQVVAEKSKYTFFLKFRDKLNSDAALVKNYNKIKIDALHLEESTYRKAKSKFIDQILNHTHIN